MSEAHILCLMCRGVFTDEQIKGHNCCPICGNKGLPGDTREMATLTFTAHEWRVLFMWADNWERKDTEHKSSVINALMREAKRQAPTLPALSLMEEFQDVANAAGSDVTVTRGDETQTIIHPEKKH